MLGSLHDPNAVCTQLSSLPRQQTDSAPELRLDLQLASRQVLKGFQQASVPVSVALCVVRRVSCLNIGSSSHKPRVAVPNLGIGLTSCKAWRRTSDRLI